MALEERTVVDRLEILRDGTVQVREAIEIVDDVTGEVKASRYHRRTVPITDDNPDMSWADADSAAVVNAARTPDRRAAAKARRGVSDGPPGKPGQGGRG